MTEIENPPAFPAAPGFDAALLAKFVERVNGGDWSLSHCWDWTGHLTDRGYGVFAPAKKVQHRAHRFALHAYLGRAPRGMVLHSCDNRACVNPKHLSEGTHRENMSQMAERRRAARGPRHPKAKLTLTKAIAINVLHQGADFSTRELAAMFAMHQSTIAAIITGDLWPDAHCAAARALADESAETLRDRFAGQALVGLAGKLQSKREEAINNFETDAGWEASLAYRIADAMLAARATGAA